jgi:hypothetical protein
MEELVSECPKEYVPEIETDVEIIRTNEKYWIVVEKEDDKLYIEVLTVEVWVRVIKKIGDTGYCVEYEEVVSE